MFRTLAWTFAAGAGLALIGSVVFPDDRRERDVGLVISVLCASTALLLWLAPHRLRPWVAHALVGVGTVAISVGANANARINNDDELLYLWVAVFSFYFFTRRQALAHMALVGVGYYVALFTRDGAVPEDRVRWFVTIASLTVAGLVVHHLATRQRATIAQLTEAVRTDPLTGLLNRNGFNDAFDGVLAATARRNGRFALIVGDLDGFKEVNDLLGHGVGDETLKVVSAVLDDSTRGGDRPARLGGEEFALIVQDAGRGEGLNAAERVRKSVHKRFAGHRVPVTISFGVAVYPDDGDTADQLMLAADRALYRAKGEGRNRSVLHSAGDGEAPPARP
jgi:diguanylate cyclase (GGDEF)-like protein